MEVEIRAKVKDPKEIRRKLEAMGAEFGKEKKQVDYIFKRKGEEKKEQKPGDFILRIRDSDKKTFTFKALTDVTGAWEEHQTAIDSPEQMKKILEKIGFTNSLTMTKKRTQAKLDDFEVCLDNVKGLGPHIEVELQSEDKNEAKKRILELLGKMGINEGDVEHKGYVTLLFEKQGVKYKGTG